MCNDVWVTNHPPGGQLRSSVRDQLSYAWQCAQATRVASVGIRLGILLGMTKVVGPGWVDFGRTVRQLRFERQISGAELARRSRLAQSTVSRIERGELRAIPSTVRRIGAALGGTDATEQLVAILRAAESSRAASESDKFGSHPGHGRLMLDLLRQARDVRVMTHATLPALIQTVEVAAACYRGVFKFAQPEPAMPLSDFLYWRECMQAELYDPRKRIALLLGEGALTWRGDLKDAHMLRQLSAMRSGMDLPHVEIRIVQSRAIDSFDAYSSFTLYDRAAFAADVAASLYVSHDLAEVRVQLAMFDAAWQWAMSLQDSRALVEEQIRMLDRPIDLDAEEKASERHESFGPDGVTESTGTSATVKLSYTRANDVEKSGGIPNVSK